MKAPRVLKVCIAVAVALWLMSWLSLNVLAAESRGEKAVNKELEKDVGMPILDGDLWQKMTHDDKIAFVWGFWHVVSMEHYLMDKYPQLKVENFSAKIIEASHKAPNTTDEVVALIDTYYQKNPDEIKKPVVGVIWDEMVMPNIKAGIAGRPLRP